MIAACVPESKQHLQAEIVVVIATKLTGLFLLVYQGQRVGTIYTDIGAPYPWTNILIESNFLDDKTTVIWIDKERKTATLLCVVYISV